MAQFHILFGFFFYRKSTVYWALHSPFCVDLNVSHLDFSPLFAPPPQAALLAPLEEDTGRGGGTDDRKPLGGASVPDFPPTSRA